MVRTIYHIANRTLGILLMILAVAISAVAQKPIVHIVVNQCETIEFSVQEMPGDRYTWGIFSDSTANFAHDDNLWEPVPYFQKGMYQGSTVTVTGLEPGRYFIRVMVWDEVNCTNNLMMYMLDILEALPTATLEDAEACIGEPTFVKIVLTGRGPWDVLYTVNDEVYAVNLAGSTEMEHTITLPPLPTGEHKIWVMEVTDECAVNSYEINPPTGRVVIFPKPISSKIYLVE